MASPAAPDASAAAACTGRGFLGFFNCGGGSALNNEGGDIHAVLAAVATSFVSLGAQLLIFLILRLRLSRIYRPRSYLVPERERLPPPPGGLIGWLYPLYTTTNLALIQKCGLDAYFFLRFLRMLLKIFLPVALFALPILVPLNHTGGGGQAGLDTYSISNIGNANTDRLWAHLILAVAFIWWFCYVVFKELRGYIRVRQAYLTSPQHRIRASATTVLVTGIPRKWLTLEALSGLYDVFPGGIRNIWINRNFDELSDKVQLRDNIARSLEEAETALIKQCRTKHQEAEKKRAKKDGRKKKSKGQKMQDQADENAAADQMAEGQGVSSGEQHQIPHGMQDILEEEERQHENYNQQARNPFGIVGHGLETFSKGIGRLGGKLVGGVDTGLSKANTDIDRATTTLNNGGIGGGFIADDTLYAGPTEATAATSPPPQFTSTLHNQANSTRVNNPQSDTLSHPAQHLSAATPTSIGGYHDSPNSDRTLEVPDIQMTRPSVESKPKSAMEIEEPPAHRAKRHPWNFLKNNDNSLAMPSPQPHVQEEDEFPLRMTNEKAPPAPEDVSKSKWAEKFSFWKKDESDKAVEEYCSAVNKDWDEDQDEEPLWRRYLEPKDRETMRLPIYGLSWFPSLPFVGQQVDKIYHLRRELARLNLEVEADQNDVEKFPLMNSAFIQFNHQVAAHMCCQSLSHHIPQQMAPRLVEISPDDILWDNMAIKWWERYLRTGIVLLVCAGLIILYAIPVIFTSLLNKVTILAQVVPWLSWLTTINGTLQAIIQGVLPPLLLSLILILVPIIFRALVRQQGVATGNAQELGVQAWYFSFLFIQVFLVVTISGGLLEFFSNAATDPGAIVRTLATNLPKASNYFFSYLTVQALSNSASALLQIGSLVGWFILAPLFDTTARSKWRRQTTLNEQQWGTFFPPFTNFAVIGLIYSIISPLILVFLLFIFSLFWIVHRYNVLFVYRFTNDTGGLLFPTAINQLFTGLYFLEICLVGLFFTLVDENGKIATLPQAIIMILVLIGTFTYQWIMNTAFKPLFQYLPITLEDEAVIRDEEFARAQASKFAPLRDGDGEDRRDIQDVLEDQERRDDDDDDAAADAEKRNIAQHRRSTTSSNPRSPEALRQPHTPGTPQGRWHDRKGSKNPMWATERWKTVAPEAVSALRNLAAGKGKPSQEKKRDVEAQHTVGDVLYSGFADELEDLTPEDRDLLVRYAFQHSALRARRPVVWIPRDTLGVSDDEIKRSKKMSTVQVDRDGGGKEERTFIWMSNEGTALDGKGRVVFRRSPPDFSNVDLIAL